MGDCYNVHRFEREISKALDVVRKVLHASRNPKIASEIHHHYDDKYLLVEFLVNTAIASQLNCLVRLGLTPAHLARLRQWAKHRSVSLKVSGLKTCTFVRKETREVEHTSGKRITDLTTSECVDNCHVETEHKVLTEVTDYVWFVDVHYEVVAYSGTGSDPAETIRMLERRGSRELTHHIKTPPRNESFVISGMDLEFSWLLSCLDHESCAPRFFIDRKSDACKTPSRNPQVEYAVEYFGVCFPRWAASIRAIIIEELGKEYQTWDPREYCDDNMLNRIFEPVLPLFENISTKDRIGADDYAPTSNLLAVLASEGRPGEGSVLLAVGDANRFLEEEWRSLEMKINDFANNLGVDSKVFTAVEASISLTLAHAHRVSQQLKQGVLFVESMMRTQLIAAIGQELTPGDFSKFMRYHNQRLFQVPFQPQPFSYAIRRSPSHAPEGTLSIEEWITENGSMSQPLTTIVNGSMWAHPMHFSLGASTKVTFTGSRFIHAACLHQFSSESGAKLNLEARARQFSSMIILVGKIASATIFEPTHAAIIQNKDEFLIPLEMSTIPTAKEFRDAIESLAPDQQAFANAFRAMQLESTLFGVLVLQVKPQMEKLLGLPENALTKEVLLTQELMKLFIDFQISSDLLSFTGDVAAPEEIKLNSVKFHVRSMRELLNQGRQSELGAIRAAKANELSSLQANYKDAQRASRRRTYSSSESESESDDYDNMIPDPFQARKQRQSVSAEAYFDKPQPKSKPKVKPKVKAKGKAKSTIDVKVDVPTSLVVDPAATQDASSNRADRTTNHDNATKEVSTNQADGKANDDRPQNQDHLVGESVIDYTDLPKQLDRRFQEFDEDNCLRPTIISPGEVWRKRSRAGGMLSAPATVVLDAKGLRDERNKAFDLLDALTKSGSLPVEHASLHMILAATHCFDKGIIETVIQDNRNPIEKIERSTLIMATAIHGRSLSEMVQCSQLPRIQRSWPALCTEAD